MRREHRWHTRPLLDSLRAALRLPTQPRTTHPDGPLVALLIDGENCPPELAEAALARAGKFGTVRVRRVYANWAAASQRGWMDTVARLQLEPIHHERTASGKNATDIGLVVDAMDLLHAGEVACFCLVASDSDYTPLVRRLRAANRIVVGLGRAQAPAALQEACSVFLALEPSLPPAAEPAKKLAPPTPTTKPVAPRPSPPSTASPPVRATPSDGGATDPAPLLLAAWGEVAQARGEVSLSNLVLELQRREPALSPQAYGHTKLAQLIKQRADLFELQTDPANPAHQVVRRAGSRPAGSGLQSLLLAAWERAPKQDGWLFTGTLGQQLKQLDPTFDPRAHGHARLGLLLQAHPELFELRQRSKGQYDVRRRQPGKKT